MTAATGIVQAKADEPFWAWSGARLELAPDQAAFFLRKRDRALLRVELSGTDPKTVPFEPGCEALILCRDLGVRLRLPCEFAGGIPGEIDTEVRLRLLDRASEWPRRLPQTSAAGSTEQAGGPERALGALVAPLFGAEIARFAAAQDFAQFCRRLNEPQLIAEAEACLRGALGRWSDEGIITLLSVHFLGAHSPEAERLRRASAARSRIDEDHADKVRRARQANELAKVERQRALACPDEVRWRLFAPADLLPAGARPPPLVKESSAPYEALASGQHLQLVIRPVTAGHVYLLALGPYNAGTGTEYRWLRLFGNGGRSDLVERAPRAGGNRLAANETLLFPGDAGAAELFQHYLTVDGAPGWESLVVAITPQELPDAALAHDLPRPPDGQGDFRAFQDALNRGLRSIFGTEARLYLFQFFHS